MNTNSHEYLRHIIEPRVFAHSTGIVSHFQTAQAQFNSCQLVSISGFQSASQAYAGFWVKGPNWLEASDSPAGVRQGPSGMVGSFLFLAEISEMAVTDQLFQFFIPEAEGE